MSVLAIRNGLHKQLSTIRGLHVHKYAPDAIPQLPALTMVPRATTYDIDFGGNLDHTWELAIFVNSGQGLERAQAELDEFLAISGSKSIKAALETDTTLDGACAYLLVRGYSDYGGLSYKGDEGEYIGVRIDVQVVE